MPRYYCDYCDTYLTHDSPSVRKQHNAGYKHKANVRAYYQQFEEQQTQSLIDQRVREHLGQSFQQQVGAAFHQHLVAMQSGQRPRPPMGQPPLMAGPRPSTMPNMQQMPPSLRPVGLPTPPIGSQGFSFPMGPSPMIPPATAVTAPPGVTPTVTQANGLFRPPALTTPGSTPPLTSIPASAPLSNGTPADHASATSGTYQNQQSNSVFTSTGYGTYNYSAPPTIYPQQSSS